MSAELEIYLNDTSHDIDSLHRIPLIKKVLIKRNTALPLSTPVKRLFSLGVQIFTPRGNDLTDQHFTMLLLIRANEKPKE